MSKRSNKTSTDKPGYPRLEGDALYEWAQTIVEERQIQQKKQAQAGAYLSQRGYKPGDYLLSDDGYIISRAEFERQMSLRLVPVNGQRDRPVVPALPDNGNSE